MEIVFPLIPFSLFLSNWKDFSWKYYCQHHRLVGKTLRPSGTHGWVRGKCYLVTFICWKMLFHLLKFRAKFMSLQCLISKEDQFHGKVEIRQKIHIATYFFIVLFFFSHEGEGFIDYSRQECIYGNVWICYLLQI